MPTVYRAGHSVILRPMGRRLKKWRWFAIVAVIAAAAVVVLPVEVFTDYVYTCQDTGSTYGYRAGLLGGRWREWYKASPLEEYVEREAPGTIVHRWHKTYATGVNGLGQSFLFRDGWTLGASKVSPRTMDEWIKHHDKAEVLALYEAFCKSDDAAGAALADKVRAEVEGY